VTRPGDCRKNIGPIRISFFFKVEVLLGGTFRTDHTGRTEVVKSKKSEVGNELQPAACTWHMAHGNAAF
jgi:hypothetical protein